MSATRDLIAAALTLADIDEHVAEMPTQAATDVRELCARAISETQPVSAAEVPMPEPVATFFFGCYDGNELEEWNIDPICAKCDALNESSTEELADRLMLESEVRIYGDAREAAGYARGLVEAKRDAERYRWLREHFRFANDSMRELWFDPALEPNDSSVPVDLDAEIDRAMSDRTWEKAMAWQPIATAPKDGARLHARDAEGVERATWFSYGDWVYDGWRETEDQQGYQTEECWEPTEWNAST